MRSGAKIIKSLLMEEFLDGLDRIKIHREFDFCEGIKYNDPTDGYKNFFSIISLKTANLPTYTPYVPH